MKWSRCHHATQTYGLCAVVLPHVKASGLVVVEDHYFSLLLSQDSAGGPVQRQRSSSSKFPQIPGVNGWEVKSF